MGLRLRLSAMFVATAAATALTVDLGFFNPRTARAEGPSVAVTIVRDGVESAVLTTATDVGTLLLNENLTIGPQDYLSMLPEAPIADGSTVVIRSARAVTVSVDGGELELHSGAPTVAAALIEANVRLNPNDEVSPSLDSPPDGDVRIVRVKTWTVKQRHRAGHKLQLVAYRYTQRDRGQPSRRLLWSRVIESQEPQWMAKATMHMIATAYTRYCYGCSGITAIGVPARRGIVAVDPAIIPLGSRLFIPGYGKAIAGDTGGAIHGSRIDLAVDSNEEAMRFGRRTVTVYVLP